MQDIRFKQGLNSPTNMATPEGLLIWGKTRSEAKVKARRIRKKPPNDPKLAIATFFVLSCNLATLLYCIASLYYKDKVIRDIDAYVLFAPLWFFIICDALSKSTLVKWFGPGINFVWKYVGTTVEYLRTKSKQKESTFISLMYFSNMFVQFGLFKIFTGSWIGGN